MNDFIERLVGCVEIDVLRRAVYVQLRDTVAGEVYTFMYSTYDVEKVPPVLRRRWLFEKSKCELANMWKEQPDVL